MKLGNPEAVADGVIETILWDHCDKISVALECTEFTCRCPVTNQPDWAKIYIEYEPRELLVESKSVKLYLETYREVGIFHEHLAIRILDDLIEALDPYKVEVRVVFNSRGGIAITATAKYEFEKGTDEL